MDVTRWRRRLTLLAGLGVLLTPTGGAFATPPNLAPDPDFESNPSAFYSTAGPGQASWATDDAHGGTHSLRIASTGVTLTRWYSNISAIRASPGTRYDVCVWIKSRTHQVAFTVNFWTASGGYIAGQADANTPGTNLWTQICETVVAPAGTAFLRVEFRVAIADTAWFDDVSVQVDSDTSPLPGRIDPTHVPYISGNAVVGQTITVWNSTSWQGAPTQFAFQWVRCPVPNAPDLCVPIDGATQTTYVLTAADIGSWLTARVWANGPAGTYSIYGGSWMIGPVTTFTPSGVNLAPDPGFEANPAGSYYVPPDVPSWAGDFTWATDVTHLGTHALKVSGNPILLYLSRWVSRYDLISVTPGRTYRACAWMKSTNWQATLVTNFWTAAGKFILSSIDVAVPGTNEWTNVCVYQTAPAGAAFMRLEFRPPAISNSTLWIDDPDVEAAA
jgi:hypothetical protein